jgi:hypothetical protein
VTRAASSSATDPAVPITKSALARLRGVSAAAVTIACKPAKPLATAVLPSGRVNLAHPAVRAWLGRDQTMRDAKPAKPPSSKDLKALGDFTPEDFIERYGSLQGFVDHVDARKKIAETQRVELQNAETASRLISRELVTTHVQSFVDALRRALLTETSSALIRRTYSMFAAGASIEEAQRSAVEILTAELTPLKAAAVRALREPTGGAR